MENYDSISNRRTWACKIHKLKWFQEPKYLWKDHQLLEIHFTTTKTLIIFNFSNLLLLFEWRPNYYE